MRLRDGTLRDLLGRDAVDWAAASSIRGGDKACISTVSKRSEVDCFSGNFVAASSSSADILWFRGDCVLTRVLFTRPLDFC